LAKRLDKLDPGTVIIYNQDVKLPVERDDCVVLGMPMTKMARLVSPKMAKLMANMYYVGALAHLLKIDQEAIRKAISQQFGGKEKAIEWNMQAISEGIEYAKENWNYDSEFLVEAREKKSKYIPN